MHRAGLLCCTQENWMVRDPELKKVALWTYYKGAKRDPGLDEGRPQWHTCRARAGFGIFH